MVRQYPSHEKSTRLAQEVISRGENSSVTLWGKRRRVEMSTDRLYSARIVTTRLMKIRPDLQEVISREAFSVTCVVEEAEEDCWQIVNANDM